MGNSPSFRAAGIFLLLFVIAPDICLGKELSQAVYQKSVQLFQAKLAAQSQEVRQKSGNYRIPGLPFMLLHGHPTGTCVVLLHGLSDSPFFMRNLAESLFDQGYNVMAPLLSGNGTHYSDLQKITLDDWTRDVDESLEIAEGLGRDIVIGGLSAGGALAVDAERRHPAVIRGLLLFSPALSFQKKSSFFSCLYKSGYVAGKSKDVPIRYQKISNNGVCQLYHLVENLDLSPRRQDYPVPIFAVLTEYDDVIKVQWTIDWIEGQKNPENRILAYIFPGGKSLLKFKVPVLESAISTNEIRHAQVTRRNNEYNDEWNPKFDEMEKALKEFMAKSFSPSHPSQR